jgi:hypothetical protein
MTFAALTATALRKGIPAASQKRIRLADHARRAMNGGI